MPKPIEIPRLDVNPFHDQEEKLDSGNLLSKLKHHGHDEQQTNPANQEEAEVTIPLPKKKSDPIFEHIAEAASPYDGYHD